MSKIISKIISQSLPPSSIDVLWFDGDNLKIFKNGKWCNTTLNSLSESKIIELIESNNSFKYLKLQACSSRSKKANDNIEKLTKNYELLGETFPISINSNIGVCRFNPSLGGEGFVTTTNGNTIYYIFGNDGSIIKTREININDILIRLEKIESKFY